MPGPYRIPGATRNVSDNFADHIARGSMGGTDFTDGYGTVMHAMADGTVIAVDNNPSGSGGRMVTIMHDDGNQTEELHGDTITAFRGMRVQKGEQIGISGASGFGQNWYYGPHIHAHGISPQGVRFDVEPYLDGTTGAGLPGSSTPNRKATTVAINFSVSKWDDGVNQQWRLISEFGWLPIPGDGSEAQLARMTQGEPAGLGPNGWAVLEAMQKMQRSYAAAVASGTPTGSGSDFRAELKAISDQIAALPLQSATSIAVAVNDEEDRRDKARLAVK